MVKNLINLFSDSVSQTQSRWQRIVRFAVSFVLLMLVLSAISYGTAPVASNKYEDQVIASSKRDTAVTMQASSTSDCYTNQSETGICATQNSASHYSVGELHQQLIVHRPENGDAQAINVLIRYPINFPGRAPSMVFMHGAGYGGSATDSFVDIATDIASAGFVTGTLDKPAWTTSSITRDYPGSAYAYDQVIQYIRGLSIVDSQKIGLYATSESTWIASYLLNNDHNIAFQIWLSPMVFTPRQTANFFASQDFSMVGANPGFTNIAQRLFGSDLNAVGLHNIDIDPFTPQSLSIPTFVAYGSKDVITPEVDGIKKIITAAQEVNNQNYVIRSYALANHVLNIGDDQSGYVADHYTDDVIEWSSGIIKGDTQTAPRIAGEDIHQYVNMTFNEHVPHSLTWCVVIIHIAAIIACCILLVFSLVLLCMRVVMRFNGKIVRYFLGKKIILCLCASGILISLMLAFVVSGFSQIVYRVAPLVWGGAPTDGGVAYWGWPAGQVVGICAVCMVAALGVLYSTKMKSFQQLSNSNLVSDRFIPLQSSKSLKLSHSTGNNKAMPIIFWPKIGIMYLTSAMITSLLLLCVVAFWGLFIFI